MTIVIDFSKGFNMGEMNKLINNLPCSDDDKENMTKQAEGLCQRNRQTDNGRRGDETD